MNILKKRQYSVARFYDLLIKSKEMRKQIKDFTISQFKDGRKNASAKKNPRYIYTEADLGEGILDVGVTANYLKTLRDQLEPSSWYPMLKTQWS